MRKIVLVTMGSLGDLHPFIAIGLALRRRGFRVVVGVPEDQLAKTRAAGLEAHAVVAGFAAVRERLGLSERDAAQRIMADQRYLMDEVLMPWLAPSATALDALTEDALAIVGSLFVFAAPVIAERRRIPLVNVVLQPMTVFSAHTPPRTPEFRMMAHAPTGAAGRWWNRRVYGAMHRLLRHRYGRPIDVLRAAYGLAPSDRALLLDTPPGTVLTLGCYSPAFAPREADAPPELAVVGFPMFDSDSGAAEALDPALEAFLAAGPPPLVFTLGSFAVLAPGDFYAAAVDAARALGLRAVLLTGDAGVARSGADIHVARYVPHSLLFPRARVIVHHGGMGSTGQALRAGVPQLVVPHMGDQHDNGHRVAALGVGAVLEARRLTAARAATAIAAIMGDRHVTTARCLGERVAAEDGAEAAADAIVGAIGPSA
jgi:UDP:flavonoid glycosyltransferase YjiC (YdhE family)